MLAMLAPAWSPAGAWAEGHAWTKRHRGSRAPAASHRVKPVHDRAYAAIVGGHFARNGQFPWVARVVAHRGKRLDLCTGTVVAANLILTAGHCAEDIQTGIHR